MISFQLTLLKFKVKFAQLLYRKFLFLSKSVIFIMLVNMIFGANKQNMLFS